MTHMVTDKSRVIRFKENNSDTSANSGVALGDNDLYEITGRWNLESFRVIEIEAGKSHVLRVQYYQSKWFFGVNERMSKVKGNNQRKC